MMELRRDEDEDAYYENERPLSPDMEAMIDTDRILAPEEYMHSEERARDIRESTAAAQRQIEMMKRENEKKREPIEKELRRLKKEENETGAPKRRQIRKAEVELEKIETVTPKEEAPTKFDDMNYLFGPDAEQNKNGKPKREMRKQSVLDKIMVEIHREQTGRRKLPSTQNKVGKVKGMRNFYGKLKETAVLTGKDFGTEEPTFDPGAYMARHALDAGMIFVSGNADKDYGHVVQNPFRDVKHAARVIYDNMAPVMNDEALVKRIEEAKNDTQKIQIEHIYGTVDRLLHGKNAAPEKPDIIDDIRVIENFDLYAYAWHMGVREESEQPRLLQGRGAPTA